MIRIGKEKWVEALLNFLAVCLGIAITFTGDGIISRQREKKEVASSLTLVKNELEDNLSFIEYSDSVFSAIADAAEFLIRYEGNYKAAPYDSLMQYCNIPLISYEITYSDEALELLKTSSIFTKIKDQELSLELIHAYGAISDEFKVIRFFHERKNKYLEDAMSPEVKEILASDNVTAERLWTAMTRGREGRQFIRELYRLQSMHDSSPVKEVVNGTISHIDQFLQGSR